MCGRLLLQGGEISNTKIFPTPHQFQGNPRFLTLKVKISNSVHINVVNNQARVFWAFSAPTPHFEPAGVTAPTPLPVHNFLKIFMPIMIYVLKKKNSLLFDNRYIVHTSRRDSKNVNTTYILLSLKCVNFLKCFMPMKIYFLKKEEFIVI